MNTQKALYDQLATRAQRLVRDLPDEFLSNLIDLLMQPENGNVTITSPSVVEAIPNRAVQIQVKDLLKYWQSNFPGASRESLAITLITAAKIETDWRTRQKTELIWTGPFSPSLPLRRTDQALLQLIECCKTRLFIVSFAVYKIERIIRALNEAAQKGVLIDICLETPDASEGKITFDTIQSLGRDVVRQSRVYIWPFENRPQSQDGRHGSLHAKVAIGDEHRLFISSANLTDYADESQHGNGRSD